MADPTPLLPNQDHHDHDHPPADDDDQPKQQQQPPNSLDEAIEKCLGELGLAQLIQAILVPFAWVFDAQQTFISVFTDAEPTWHCTTTTTTTCTPNSDVCQIPRGSWDWNVPVHSSVIAEWGLECASPLIKGLPASSFFVGCLAGGLLLATLADSSLGRKNMLFFCSLLMSFSALLTVFSSNIWIYSALKFLNGFGRATIGTCALVLSTELVGKRWRGQVGVAGFFFFTLGFLSLPAIAYLNKGSSWRALYLWTSIPTFFYCVVVHFLVRESPRWLLVRGRKDEAVSVLKSMIAPPKSSGSGSGSGSSITMMSFSDLTLTFPKQETCTTTGTVDLYSAVKILLQRKWAFRRLLAVMVAGFGIGMVYYGMPLGLGNMEFDLYLSVILNALSEVPSSLLIFFLIGKLDRKISVLIFTGLSGVCGILCVVMPNIQIGLELASFFGACTAFDVLMIYALELFPTCVRNSAVSMVRQALVFGGVFSPVLVAAGGRQGFLSFVVFGLVILICGLFVGCLPETRGQKFYDTMEEQEHNLETSSRDNGTIGA